MNILRYELNCHACSKWFELLARDTKQAQRDLDSKRKTKPFRSTLCPHCGTSCVIPVVGKYDKPNTPKSRCAVQHVTVDK